MSDGAATGDLREVPRNARPVPGDSLRRFFIVAEPERGGYQSFETRVEVAEDQASLVSSHLRDSELHAPAIDIDVPAFLVPSSSQGHSR